MRLFAVSFIVVLVDQGSKILVKGFSVPFLNLNHSGLQIGESIPMLGNYFKITFIENPGIAFGIQFNPLPKLLITIFSILATAGLIIYFIFSVKRSLGIKLSLALIIGGAIGNLIDRLFYGVIYGYGTFLNGNVVDFLDIRFFDMLLFNHRLGSYVFNFADIAVTTGMVLFLIALRKEKRMTERVIPSTTS